VNVARESECLRALDKHEADLAKRKNVVGLGVVPRDGDPKSEDLAVAVYVERKLPPDALAAKDLVPKFLKVNESDETIDVPTVVIEQGPVTLESIG
jgi:hypothetical protein